MFSLNNKYGRKLQRYQFVRVAHTLTIVKSYDDQPRRMRVNNILGGSFQKEKKRALLDF